MSDKKDFLFELIHSLTPSEKRHFSIFAARHTIGKENNSLRMFKRMDALKTYNERKFLFRNAPEDFTRHFRFNKHFLYKLILHSLHAFHSGKTVEAELRETLHHIDILNEKGLFVQAEDLISTAKIKAAKYQFHTIQLELLSKEVGLARDRSFTGKTEKDIDALFVAYKNVMQQLKVHSEYDSLSARMSVRLTRGGFVRSKSTLDELIGLDTDTSQKKVPDQFRAAWHFHTIRLSLYFYEQDTHKALTEIKALVTLVEAHPHLIKENPRLYINALHNEIVLLSNLHRFSEVVSVAKKIESIPVRTQNLRNRKFYASHNLVLSMYVASGDFEKGAQLLKEMDKKLASGEVQFVNTQQFITHDFAAAGIYFGLGDFSASNKYIQRIIARSDLSSRSDILCFVHILRMIVQFEMQKQDLLEYSVRSAYRFLYKRNRIYKFEDIMLSFIRKKMPLMNSKKEIADAFKTLRQQLLPLTKDKFEKNAFAYFDIISWLDSKISGRSFAEVVGTKVFV